MATAQISRAEGTFLRLGDVCERFSLAPSTVRDATNSGALPCVRFGARRDRRIREADVLAWLGIDPSADQGEGMEQREDQGAVPIAVVVRVSTGKQCQKSSEGAEASSFDHQKERLTEFLRTDPRFQGKRLSVKFYEGRGVSGLKFDAPHLTALITDVLNGRYRNGFIVAQDSSRILRFGSALLTTIAQANGAQVLFTNPQIGDSDLTTDILDILTFYTAKASGKKSSFVTTRRIDPETLAEASRLHRQGCSIRAIFAKLKSEGRNVCTKTGKRYSYRTLHRSLTGAKGELLSEALASDQGENSFARFMRERLSRMKGASLTRPQVVGAYSAYCKANDLATVSPQTIVATWRKLGGKIARPNNETRYCGYAFK